MIIASSILRSMVFPEKVVLETFELLKRFFALGSETKMEAYVYFL